MAGAIVQQQAANTANTSTHSTLTLGSMTPSAGNTIVVCALSAGAGSTGSIVDVGGTNTYTFIGSCHDGGSAIFLNFFYAANVPATAVAIKNSSAIGIGLYAAELSGLSATPLITSAFAYQNGTQGTTTNGVTSGAVSVATVPAFIFGFTADDTSSTGAAFTAGTGFTLGTGVWPNLNSNTLPSGFPESLELLVGGSQAATFTSNSAGQFDQVFTGMVAFAEATAAPVYDGTTASGTVVSTGTGGTALPSFSVGQLVHVVLMAQTASALTESGPSDGHNTYTNLQTFDDHANGFIWDRWYTVVTVPITNPVITTTWSGTAKLAVFASVLGNINTGAPLVTGAHAQSRQTAPSGTDAQTTGPTISPNLLVPVTVAAWGFSVNEAAAPAAGTGFTQIGTAGAGLGAACMTYETKTSNSAIQQIATFTPVSGNTYSFVDVFNQIGSAPPTVPASGPMPRQIYVMP